MRRYALPDRITTSRLLIRAWQASDAPAMQQSTAFNLDHLLPWIPWAFEEPITLEARLERLERFAAMFNEGEVWHFGIFTPDELALLGGIGLHARIGPSGLEIGYWMDREQTGKGYITEATEALTQIAFTLEHVDHVEIHCDPRNAASARIPEKLGFELVEVLPANWARRDGEMCDTMLWRKGRRR